MILLRIAGDPARNFVRNREARSLAEPKEAAHELLVGVSPIRSGDENANLSITLQNAAGQCSALFAMRPSTGAAAVLYDDAGERFAGIVTAITLSADSCTLEVQS